MIKKIVWLFLFFITFSLYSESLTEISKYNEITDNIVAVEPPKIYDKYVVFTADGKSRYVGISFAHENYQHIHSFKKLVRDESSEIPSSSVLFYVMQIPEELDEIQYRMEIDGIWTSDPLNSNEIFDFVNGFSVSVLKVPYYKEYKTSIENQNTVNFVYIGESNQIIRLAGDFNNWDPFMYKLDEIAPGRYEIRVKLPRGVWRYAYFNGLLQMHDNTNLNHVYTKDGRIASVITID